MVGRTCTQLSLEENTVEKSYVRMLTQRSKHSCGFNHILPTSSGFKRKLLVRAVEHHSSTL